jgi:PKD repeat protein
MKHSTKMWLLQVLWLFLSFNTLAVPKDFSGKNPSPLSEKIFAWDATMHVNAPPPPITGNASVCEGEVEVYTYPATPGYVYIWSVTSGSGTPSGNTLTVTWGSPGSGTVTLIVKNALGVVVDTQVLPVTIHSKPYPYITASFSPSCEKRSKEGTPNQKDEDCLMACDSSIVVYTTPLNPGSTYTWTVIGANSFTPSANTVTVYWGAPGAGLIRVEETNIYGCTNAYEKCVTIIESPDAFFTSIPAAVGGVINICDGQTVQFYDASTGSIASPLSDWFWNFGDGGTSTDQNPSHTFYNMPSGTYDVIMYVENQCHCKDSFMVKVVVSSDPPPKIECISTVCANGVDHYHTPSGCAGATYNWSVTGGVITTLPPYGPDIDVQWGASGPGIVTLQILGCGGVCPTPASVVVSIISPTTTISGPNPACTNSTSIYSIPNMPGSIYTWTVTGGFIMSGQGTEQVEVFWFSGTSGTISVTYVNPTLHCDGSASMVVNLRPQFNISGQNQVCEGSTQAYTATPGTPAENAAYNWVVTNSSNTVVAMFGGSNVYNINWTFGPGIYKITATNGSGAFCNSPQSFFVTVYGAPPPPTFITGKNPVCPNSSAMYTSAPTMSGTFIEWTVINGAPVSASGNQLTVTWGPAGPYILEVRQVSMTFPYCPSPPFRDTIESKLPAPAYAVLGPTPVCKNTIQNYNANSSYGDTYTWSISPSTMGSVIGGQGTPNVQIQWNNTAGVATINLAVTTCGVVSNVNLPVTLTNPPPPVIIGPSSICQNVGLPPFSTTTTGTAFAWDFGDGSPIVPGAGPHSHPYGTPGTYNVTLTVTNPNGCIGVSSTVFLVNVKPAPDAAITTPDPTIYCPPGSPIATTLYFSALLQPGSTVDWYESSMGYVGSGITYPATATGTYWAVVTSANGCSTTSNVIKIKYGTCVPCPIDPHYLNYTATKTGCLSYNFSGNISSNGRVLGWNFNDPWNPVGSTSLTPSHNFVEPGYYNVIFSGRFPKTGFPGDSCDRDTFMTVVVPIKAKFNYEITCGGASDYIINFLDLSTYVSPYTITNWSWSFPGGTPSVSSLQNPSVSFPAGTTPLVTLTITTTVGPGSPYTCTIQLPVNVPVIPSMTISAPTFTCQGTPVPFTVTGLTGVVNSWNWNFGDGSSSLLQPTTRTYTAPTSGVQNVVLTVTDQFGCPRQFFHNILVHANNLTATVSAAGPTTFCDGQSVTLNAVVGGGVPLLNYLWNTVDITNSIVVTQTGGYWFQVEDSRSCRATSNTLNVLVNPVPQAMIVGDDDYCFGETTLLSAYQGSGYTYQWLINGSPSITGPTFSQIQSPATYNFQVIITNTSNGCKDTSAPYPVVVHPLPPPPGLSSAPTPACEGTAVTLTGIPTVSPYTFNWSTGATSNAIVVYNAGLYTLTQTDKFGCQSENSTQVFELPDFSNLLQGCYEFCDSAPVTLVGPVGIGFTYQWYFNGSPIPGPAGTMKDYVIPIGVNGIFSLEITTWAGCTSISGPIDVTWIHCRDCPDNWRFKDIVCVLDSNGTQVYYFTVDIFNPFGPGATYSIGTTGGFITGLSPSTLTPGSNLISGFFIDVPPMTNPFCITGTIYWGEKERCILKETCVDLPPCQKPEPCHAEHRWLSVVCAGIDANGNPQYYFDYWIGWPGANGSPILTLTSPDGTITNVSINDINNGINILSGIFTSTNGSGKFCFEMYVLDPSTGKVCYIKDCIELPRCEDVDDCGRRAIRLKGIKCNGFDINGNQTYNVDFTISNPFGSDATIYFTSPDGGLSGFTPNNIPPGTSLINGLFTDLAPAGGTICVTVIIVEDATGKTCKQTICFTLPPCDSHGNFAGINTAEETNSGNSILVNPNPAKEQTVISYTFTSGSNRTIAITDMYGRTVKVFKVVDDKGSIVLPTSTYSPGVYLVTGFTDNKLVDSRRLIIIK